MFKVLTAAALMALLASPASHAETVASTYYEQGKLIRAGEAVGTLGADLFGDKVNLYNGTLEFIQTDVSLPGNNALPVSVGRRLATGSEGLTGRAEAAFGDWELEIPHLHGVYSTYGWKAQYDGDKRCSRFSMPPVVGGTSGPSTWVGTEYWHGHFMYVPGAGSQEILKRDPSNLNYPADGSTGPDNQVWPLVTKNLWSIRCLGTLARGVGEGFIAVSPDGTQYRFDWLVSRSYPSATKATRSPIPGLVSGGTQSATRSGAGVTLDQTVIGTPGGWGLDNIAVGGLLSRSEVWIMPTLVTDRYGNTVTYTYDAVEPWKVKTIVSSDGRSITFTYLAGTQRIQSIYDGSRIWNYSYRSSLVGAMLDRVTLPDNSFWQFTADRLSAGAGLYLGSPTCDDDGGLNPVAETGTMKHPSGATGSFTIFPTTHSKSFVERICRTDADFTTSAYFPRFFAHKSLTNKTITGPGLSAMAWNYSYSDAMASSSWSTCTGNCPDTKSVSVTDPRGYVTRYTFGNRHRVTEGQLLKVEAGWNGLTALRTTTTRYRDPAAGPYPTRAGASLLPRGNGELAGRYTPEDLRVINQQGVDFTWQASGFDSKARPATVARSSSPDGPSRTETTTYYDHLSKWVLGQVKKVESGTQVMVENAYDEALTGNLLSTKKFGLLDQRFTYYPDGTLWTRADGLSQATTFSNYARGLAQNVSYADGKTESATVDNMGLIRSVTDANTFMTKYDYDPIGRLKTIERPTGDTVVWNPTSLVFEQVALDEYGLGTAGYWRQTVTTGNAKTITYFDALWRPRVRRTFDATNATTEGNTAKTVLRNFDSDNRKVFESYAARNVDSITATPPGTSTEYDGLGRPIKVVAGSEFGPLITLIDYLTGFKKRVTNPRGYLTTTGYQVFDEPSESAIATIAAPETLSVSILRDKFGKPTSITRSGTQGGTVSATRSYVYDNYERLCKTVEPEIGATIQAYDAANNTIWRASGLSLTSLVCDRGSVPDASKVSYAYTDKRNRLTGTGFGDGSAAIGRAYTPDGLISSVVSGSSTWTYSYNKRRLLTEENLLSNAASHIIRWGYNPNGHTSQLTYPDNAVLSYAPNALGEATQVSGYTQPNTVTYHPNGGVAGYTLANGTVHTQTQNVRGLPLQNADAGVMADLYSYDTNGNVTAITDQQQGISSRGMGYDGLDRLTAANAPGVWGNGSYSYDALDNIRTSVVGARNSVHNYNPSTNRLDTINSNGVFTGFVYDKQGNIIGRGSRGYYFDQGNRMQLANGVASYTYDGWGRRTTITDASGNRVQVYGQAGQLLYGTRQQGGTTVATRYVYLGGKAIAETDTAVGTTYLFTDALGSPVARVGTGPAAVGYSCPSGWTLSGSTCTQATTSTIAATLAGYNCPAGYTLSGSTCSQTTATSTAATVSYSCPAGWSLSGTTCSTSSSSPATPVYTCPAGWSLSGTTCSTSTTSPATPVYTCPAGWGLSGSTCTTGTSTPATPVYTCPAGFTLSGTSCTGTSTTLATVTLNCNGYGSPTVYTGSPGGYKCTTQNLLVSDYPPPDDPYVQCQSIAASMGLPLVATPLINNSKTMQCVMGPLKVYSCPSGGSLSGSVCVSAVTQGASIGSYTCASGTLSGSSCITGSSAAATASYSCPSGTSLSGTSCNGASTTSTPGTPVYSCPAGTTLAGSSCTTQGTATAAATAAWTCPNGGTLSGTSCLGAMWRTRYEAYGNTAAGTIPNGIGFTGHVNDAETGLVYMQQRYYDPVAARFMSLDPVVTDANTGASFGRYHYADNNPYRFIDPDGRNPGPPANLADCQSATGTDCGWRGSNTARANVVLAGGVLTGTLLTAGCTFVSSGACVLGGATVFGVGFAGGALIVDKSFTLVEWMQQLIYNSTGANSSDTKPPESKPASGATRPEGVPEDWKEEPGKKEGNTKWVSPNNPHDYVRTKPDGTVTQVRDGKAYDANGKRVDLKSPGAHGITPERFIFRP